MSSEEKITKAKAQGKPKRAKKPMTLKKLIITSVILLVVPYAYLMLCGLIFDTWLNMPEAVLFIFYSLITFWIVDIGIIIYLTVRYIRNRKRR